MRSRHPLVLTLTLTVALAGCANDGGEITGSNTDVAPGTFIWFQGIDGGEGSGGGPDQSTGSGFGTVAENQAFCDSPAPPNPIFLAEIDGDIQVDD